MQNLFKDLENLLKKDNRLIDKEGELLRNKAIELGLKLDEQLLKLLISNERFKKEFFVEIDKILVFNKEKFLLFVNNKQLLPDSYTSFKLTIGLAVGEDHIKENEDVVLSFPFKDCVLEGGQTKEEESRKEIFWNTVLAPDEVDKLYDPKVLTNFKMIDTEGQHKINDISNNDNLIISGNNLLALYSLRKRLHDKVKLIYIDPPYNTGNDSFRYNDKFNHSTYLTFMKNRLEIARELLASEGVIAIHCDDNEQAYLQVLMDEIFKKENFITTIAISRSSAAGHKTINPTPVNVLDFIIIYSKEQGKYNYKPQFIKSVYDSMYSSYIENKEETHEKWRIKKVGDVFAKELGFKSEKEAKKKLGDSIFDAKLSDFALGNSDKLFELTAINFNGVGKEIQKITKLSEASPDKVFKVERGGYEDMYILNGRKMTFYKIKVKEIDGEISHSKLLTNIWTDISWNGISHEGGVTLNKGKKPEALIKRLLDIFPDANLVLDFFAGSGTTCAVAHKMGKQYVGIEQLDYGSNDSVTRLTNVIKGDKSGVSKAVDWKGGGQFIHCELMQLNHKYIEQIQRVKSKEELQKIYKKIKENAFISYKIDIEDLDKNISSFEELSFDDQKRFLLEEMLDKNQLYVNLSELGDKTYDISEEDKRINKQFYEGNL